MRAAAGPERLAHGHLTPPCIGAYQKEVRDVRARHEQHEPDRCQQDPQRASDLADDGVLQRQRGGDPPTMIGRHAREVRQELGHLGASARERGAITQPRHAHGM